jgi:RecB family endonuclease NucS
MQAEFIWDQLAKNLALLEPGLTLIQLNFRYQIFVNKGNINILAKDVFDNYVIIEVKRSKLTSRETLEEVLKYIGLIKYKLKDRDSEIRVIIVSTHWEELIVPFSE